MRTYNRYDPALKRSKREPKPAPAKPTGDLYEADVLPGLEMFAQSELKSVFGGEVRFEQPPVLHQGRFAFLFKGNPTRLLTLRSLVGVYRVIPFEIPRPKALLGHEHFVRLLAAVRFALDLHPPQTFQTLRLGAAGGETDVMQRLTADLAKQTGLSTEQDTQDLLLRLRRNAERTGWEALVSLTPRPLSTRAWRVCNFAGSMNATLAYAMTQLSFQCSMVPAHEQTVLNICCGGATLLIERATFGAKELAGYDISPAALECARANIEAANLPRPIVVHNGDATALPVPGASFDILLADLPFGQQVGSHRENKTLYPRLLAEATRVAKPGGVLVWLTYEVRLLQTLLEASEAWNVEMVHRVEAGGMTPAIFVSHRL